VSFSRLLFAELGKKYKKDSFSCPINFFPYLQRKKNSPEIANVRKVSTTRLKGLEMSKAMRVPSVTGIITFYIISNFIITYIFVTELKL